MLKSLLKVSLFVCLVSNNAFADIKDSELANIVTKLKNSPSTDDCKNYLDKTSKIDSSELKTKDDETLELYNGICQEQLNNNDEAVKILKKVSNDASQQDVKSLAGIKLAGIYLKNKSYKLALDQFEYIKDNDPTISSEIAIKLDAIIDHTKKKKPKDWGLNFSLGFTGNNNATFSGANSILIGNLPFALSNAKTSGYGIYYTLSAFKQFVVNDKLTIVPSVNVISYEYLNNQNNVKLSDYSTRFFGGQVNFIASDNKHITFALAPTLNGMMFGNQMLNYSYGFNSTTTLKSAFGSFNKYIVPEIYASFIDTKFQSSAMNYYSGYRYSSGLGLGFNVFYKNNQIARIVPYVLYEGLHAGATYASYDAYIIGLRYYQTLPLSSMLIVNINYRNRGFDAQDTMFLAKRNGWIIAMSVTLKKSLDMIYNGLSVYASYDYLKQESGVTLFSFQKHQGTVGFEVAF